MDDQRPSDPRAPESGGGLEGHLDGIGPDGWLEGWAADLEAPHRTVEIRVLEGERLLALGSANRPRADVHAAGFGTGFSGFSLALPEDVFDGRARALRVVARTADGRPRLLGTLDQPLTRPPGATGLRPPDPLPADRAPGRGIQALRAEFAAEGLAAALGRIDELERAQRALAAQRDALQARLRALGQRFGHDLDALADSPLAEAASDYLAGIVRSLSLTQRRALWLAELSRRGLAGRILATMPHDGAPGPLRVLVWGSGGIGDLIYPGTIVRELFLALGGAEIFVLHENPAVHEVFAGNPYVAGTLVQQGKALDAFVHAVHTLDVFDLVAEVRYCVTYGTPPLSRAPRDLVATARHRAAEWQRYVRHQWPHLNNLFANEVLARGMNKLSLVGLTAALPIGADSELDVFLPGWFPELLPELADVPFATLHNGSDPKMSADGGVQTKNLPTAAWNQIAHRLAAAGLKLVQLGEAHEALVEGVDFDLRGRTSLAQAGYVLKMASVHVDTEGGLVHLARAMQTPSVVAFGPTPVGFFGYPQNDNIAAPVCGNCWWITDRWATECPRALAEPECMAAHAPAVLAERALELAGAGRRMAVIGIRAVPAEAAVAALREAVAAVATPRTRGALLLGDDAELALIGEIARPAGELTVLVPADGFAAAHAAFGHARLVMPYGGGNLSRNTASLDWAVVLGGRAGAPAFVPALLELARCVRPGGRLLLHLPPEGSAEPERLRADLLAAQARLPGTRARVLWPESVGAPPPPAGHALLLDLGEPG